MQRFNGIIDNQVRSLRKRQLSELLEQGAAHDGAHWGNCSRLADYPRSEALDCPVEKTLEPAASPTRLNVLNQFHQERLINWGYAVCAAAVQSHGPPGLAA